MALTPIRLGVNLDHVATVRNARGGSHPDPLTIAKALVGSGMDGITIHLREDRRHIRDADAEAICAWAGKPVNFEMAATSEMLGIAVRLQPHGVCVVPEKRAEITTEGGLDVISNRGRLRQDIVRLADAGIRVSLFVDPDPEQLEAAAGINGGGEALPLLSLPVRQKAADIIQRGPGRRFAVLDAAFRHARPVQRLDRIERSDEILLEGQHALDLFGG